MKTGFAGEDTLAHFRGSGAFSPVALTTRISTALPKAHNPSRHAAYSMSKLVRPSRTVRALTRISSA